jgi:hypothetical protein
MKDSKQTKNAYYTDSENYVLNKKDELEKDPT